MIGEVLGGFGGGIGRLTVRFWADSGEVLGGSEVGNFVAQVVGWQRGGHAEAFLQFQAE